VCSCCRTASGLTVRNVYTIERYTKKPSNKALYFPGTHAPALCYRLLSVVFRGTILGHRVYYGRDGQECV